MTSRYVQPDEIYKRYETHHKKVMTLYVTRQNQQFVVANDITLCDLELIRSSVELVGEPGVSAGNAGVATGTSQIGFGYTQGSSGPYGSTVNALYDVNKTVVVNAVQHKTHINHGWMNIEIEGMSQARNFMRDDRQLDNELSLVVPTDSGIISIRAAQQNGPPHSLVLENIKLEQNIRIACQFAGSGSKQSRTARFVEDFADADPTTYRSSNGSVKYYDDSGGAADTKCQIPSNLVNCMILQFQMTPRSTV
jgi:hypothetical protein